MPASSLSLLALATAAASLPGVAAAEPARQVIEAACTAAAPAEGHVFSGPVLQVIDGERLCVAAGPTPAQWIAVRPQGVSHRPLRGAEARSLLMSATFSRRLDCVAGRAEDGAVTAVCTVEGADLMQRLRAAEADPTWRSWR